MQFVGYTLAKKSIRMPFVLSYPGAVPAGARERGQLLRGPVGDPERAERLGGELLDVGESPGTALLVGNRLVLQLTAPQGAEELGLRLLHAIRVREGEVGGHHGVQCRHIGGERRDATLFVGRESACTRVRARLPWLLRLKLVRRCMCMPVGWSMIGQQGFPAITVPAGFTTEVYDRIPDASSFPILFKALENNAILDDVTDVFVRHKSVELIGDL